LLIGCGALVLVVGICLVFLVYQVGKNPGGLMIWSLNQMENAITPQIPADVTAEEREQLKTAFANVRRKVEAGELSMERLQPINYKILEYSRKEGGIKRQDVLELTALLEGLAGGTTEVANPTPETIQRGAEPASQAP
jgi:HAMP domain-containing protein